MLPGIIKYYSKVVKNELVNYLRKIRKCCVYIFRALHCGASWPSIYAQSSDVWSSLLNFILQFIIKNRLASHLTCKNIFVHAISIRQPRAKFVIVNAHMHARLISFFIIRLTWLPQQIWFQLPVGGTAPAPLPSATSGAAARPVVHVELPVHWGEVNDALLIFQRFKVNRIHS